MATSNASDLPCETRGGGAERFLCEAYPMRVKKVLSTYSSSIYFKYVKQLSSNTNHSVVTGVTVLHASVLQAGASILIASR